MAIETIDNFGIYVGKNIDSRYGPYDTTASANTAIDPIFRFKGLTVLLTGSGDQIEYWYYNGITDPDLVPKGAAITIQDESNLVTSNASILNFTGSGVSASLSESIVNVYVEGTRIIAGTNITIDPPGIGTGEVIINSSAAAGSGLAVAATASFNNLSVWNFTHNLKSRYVIIQALDNNHQQIIPEYIELIDTASARLTFPTQESGYAIASIGGITASLALTASSVLTNNGGTIYGSGDNLVIDPINNLIISGNLIPGEPYSAYISPFDLGTLTTRWSNLYVGNRVYFGNSGDTGHLDLDNGYIVSDKSFSGSFSGSFYGTASWAQSASQAVSSSRATSASYALSASYAVTASYVTNLNQTVTIGNITSTPSTEATLNIYPPIVSGTGEGGQILLAASGGLYTSASMLDTWQDQFRVLRGSNTGGSNAGLMYMNLQSGNTQFVGAVTASAYSGLPNDYLYVTRNTSQTIGSGNWANQDIIFNNSVVSKGISYNTGTGRATLTGGKVYRITARLAWSAAAPNYTFQFSCYDSSNNQLGPTVEIVQSTNTSNNISDGTLDFIYAPGSNIDIKIRTTNNTTALSGESIRGDLNTQLIIQQIA